MSIWHVYIVECADGSLYCGVTTDVVRRVAQHNGELAGGARCTRARRPVRLVLAVKCENQSAALRLEAQVKRLPKKEKKTFLQATMEGSPL